MTLLITILIIALLLVLGTLIAALFEVRSKKPLPSRNLPSGWWDIYILTYQDIVRALVYYWHDFLPHLHDFTVHTLSHMLAHRDRMYARIFGYPAVPQGGVVSFFLKRILEHKEEFRQKVAQRRAVHEPIMERKERKYFADIHPKNDKNTTN